MNKVLVNFFIITLPYIGNAQNLVSNGDFEQYSGCPNFEGQIDLALYWSNPAVYPGPGGSPDYFHQCATDPFYGTPANFFGFQEPHSGEAYSGFVAWRSNNPPNWNEYLEVALTSTLTANQCYVLEMYISLANQCFRTSDDIGVYFSDTLISGITNYLPLPFTPQINFTLGLPADTLNWMLLSGYYIASGNENYLTIGNYKDYFSSNSIVINTAAPLDYSYFHVDDVSLTPCTGIGDTNLENMAVAYPNPFNSTLNFNIPGNDLLELDLYDITARKIYQKFFSGFISLNTEHLEQGIYFYVITDKLGVIRKGKLLKD